MCMPFPNDFEKAVATAYARADVVFLGDAMAIRNTVLGILQQREVTFSVRDRWKGSIPDTTLVRTNIGEIACGYNFKKRTSYLVFAYWDQQREHLTTSFCDLTRTEAKAKGAIGVLDRLTKRANAAARHDGEWVEFVTALIPAWVEGQYIFFKHTLDVIAHTRPHRHSPIRSSSPGCISRKQSFSRPTQNDAEGRKMAKSERIKESIRTAVATV